MIQIDVAEKKRKVASAIASAGSPARLIGFEAVEIQRFVTASSRPVAIHGASEAIKLFDDFISRRVETVFAGGGRGVLVVPERHAPDHIEDLKREFRRLTHGSPLAVADAPFDPAGEAASLDWLRLKQATARYACDPEQFELDFSRGACADCHARPANRRSEKPDSDNESVCDRCYSLVRVGREIEKGEARGRWTLEHLSTNGKIAVVCADGNHLGLFFRSLHSLAALAIGSAAISDIFKTAHREAMKHAGEPRNVALVAGGDDLKAFLPPEAALEYVGALVSAVERQAAAVDGLAGALGAESLDRLRGLGVGVGLFVAPYQVPASRLVDQARDLEKEAKRFCLRNGARSAVDFAIVASEGGVEEASSRTRKGLHRPVAGDHWAQVLRNARALGEVPAAQRSAASDAWSLDEAERDNRFYYQLARSESWQAWFRQCSVDWRDRKAVRQHIPDPAMLALARLIEGRR
ncbi:Cas10/Cmr2 second palm domain-containing protein [Sorangium sp. So ce341]|uniref:Cas10/Cmr2 second palm domain-containing protein n=1 Tax=Sorangium sp. So ce341 TaxID=3133302 RepID=UPI003F604936